MKADKPLYKLGMLMAPNVWRSVKIETGSACFVGLFNVVIYQFYIVFAIQQGASYLQVGLLSAIPAFGLLFSPLWAIWIEKVNNPQPFFVVPNVIGRLFILLPALYPRPDVFLAAAFAHHLLMGATTTAYASCISRLYPDDIRGRLLGYVRVAMGCLMIPSAYVVGRWADASGPSGPLFAAVGAGLLSILLFARLKFPAAQPLPAAIFVRRFSLIEQWRLVTGNKTLLVFLAATILSGFGNMLAVPLYQIVQVDTLQLSNVEIGYARVGYFIGLLLTFFFGGRLIDRFDLKYTMLGGIASFAVVPLLYGVWGTYPAVIAGNAVQGIGDAIWDFGILSFLLRLVPGREASLYGLYLMTFGIRGTLAPLASTALMSYVSMNLLLLVAAALSIAGAALFWYGNRSREGVKNFGGVY